MSATIALHKITNATVLSKAGVAPILRTAFADKTETLHLIRDGGVWAVSSQVVGMRLAGLQTSRAARLYMKYMLDHVGDELRALSPVAQAANDDACSGVIREVHFKALEQAGE